MRKPALPNSAVLRSLAAAGLLLLWTGAVHADSLRLLTDLEYDMTDSTITEKATNLTYETERVVFSQLYSLDVQKDLMPNLKLNFGALFDQEKIDSTTTDPGSQDSDANNTTVRPYIDLQLNSPLLQATTGYRMSEIKRRASFAATTRAFTEEFSAGLDWKPVVLPEVDLDFTRTLSYNEPQTNDQQIDDYRLRSRYRFRDYTFDYSHTTNLALNRITDFETLTNTDHGSIRFGRNYRQGAVAVTGSLRARRQAIEFSGVGDRLVPTRSVGVVIGNREDPFPQTSDPAPDFELGSVDLLADSLLAADQLSFGLDFGTPTEVDRLFIQFVDLGNAHSDEFQWRIYVRDNDTENWSEIGAVRASTSLAENRFELAFAAVETRFIKIVTTPLAPPAVPAGENLLISDLVARRTLAPDTSEIVTIDWSGDLTVNWKHSDRTSTGYDLLYREERAKPLDEKRTLLSTGARLSHRFNEVYAGNMRVHRAASREQGEGTAIDDNFSASLTAKYLETFDQSLTYSHNRQVDADGDLGTANTVLLRSNLALYEGWSLFLDTGYSWQHPPAGEKTNSTFLRVGSNIVPNRWLNLSLSYGVSWDRETGRPLSRDQDGRLVITWVPTSALSLSADLTFTDETGEDRESTVTQQYFVNWSPFRDGTLMFTMGYGYTNDSDEEQGWSLSPALRWQVNRKTQLTVDYTLGEREDLTERVEFENIGLALRFFF